MRDSVEKLINANGMTKTEYFNYDEEGNHITKTKESILLPDQLDWTDPITDATDLQKFQVKYIHIEDLRHYIEEIWENFTKGGSGSCSSVGAMILDQDDFVLQKNQLWEGETSALIETYNHSTWLSTSNSSSSIATSGIGSASCHANAGNGYYVGYQIYGSDARATTGLSAAIPVISYTTKFPCSKLIYNPVTQVYDTYHLFIKAACAVSLSASGSYYTGPVGYTRLPPDPFTLHPNKDDWDAAPIVPNPYHTSKAEAVLTIATYKIGGGAGQYIQWVDGEYHNGEPPLGGIPVASLNNFNIDIGQAIIDTYSLAPEGYAVILFSFGCIVRGTGNSLDMKAGQAEYVPAEYPLVGYWRGPYTPTGGKGDATASFVIDNINFYYKKI
jgi:hypothetical protein